MTPQEAQRFARKDCRACGGDGRVRTESNGVRRTTTCACARKRFGDKEAQRRRERARERRREREARRAAEEARLAAERARREAEKRPPAIRLVREPSRPIEGLLVERTRNAGVWLPPKTGGAEWVVAEFAAHDAGGEP